MTLDGKSLSLIPLTGKQSVVVFFDSTCKPCIEQLTDVQKLVDNGQINANVSIVAATKEKPETVKRFIEVHKITISIIPDAVKLANSFNVDQYPFTYVINENGFVELREAGFEKTSAIKRKNHACSKIW